MGNMTEEALKQHSSESLDETYGEYDILALLSKHLNNEVGEDNENKVLSDGKLSPLLLSIFDLSSNTMWFRFS